MYYPKIDTLFDRDDKFKVDESKFRRPEFAYVNDWLWMEKLDGSNISIKSDVDGTIWRGRTPRSNFIPDIENHLNMRVENWHDHLQAILQQHKLDSIEIFGEVFGPKIQFGGIYRDDITTKFYDIRVNGSTWLSWDAVLQYSLLLGYDVPAWDTYSLTYLIKMVRNGFTTFEEKKGGISEGVVAKTPIPLYTNKGDRLMWKLKTKDFA